MNDDLLDCLLPEEENDPPADPPKRMGAFGDLLDEIRGAPSGQFNDISRQWNERLESLWRNPQEQWPALIQLLPLTDLDDHDSAEFKAFPTYLIPDNYIPKASDLYLCQLALASKLFELVWTDQLGSRSIAFVAGCINLAKIAAGTSPDKQEIQEKLEVGLSSYLLTIIGIGLHHPDLIVTDESGCRLADTLQLSDKLGFPGRLRLEVSQRDVEVFVDSFNRERAWGLSRRILPFDTDVRKLLRSLLRGAAKDLHNSGCRELLKACSSDDAKISTDLSKTYLTWHGHSKNENFELWARYVSIDDAFQFCWEIVRPAHGNRDSSVFGNEINARIKYLHELLTIPEQWIKSVEPNAESQRSWRAAAVRVFSALGSLAELRWGASGELGVRQEEAIDALASYPELVPGTIRGILDQCQDHWDAFDPIILGLPSESSVPVLRDYVDHSSLWTEARFHARRLLAHARGEAIVAGPEYGQGDLLTAAEALIRSTRTRTSPITAQTWVGEASVEKLWHGAIESAQRRFDDYLATQFGQDEHEHCAVLADTLAQELNATNAAVQNWLRASGARPAFVRASVRRIPRRSRDKAPQEGGPPGLHADFALLLKCNVAGRCVAKRVTLIQAKKLAGPNRSGTWPAESSVSRKDKLQLKGLLAVSECAHYLFILPRELGQTLGFLPALLVRDILAGRRTASGVPVPTILQAAVSLSDFILFHVIGLWTGDDDGDLIARLESGENLLQGARVVIEVTVSQENEERRR